MQIKLFGKDLAEKGNIFWGESTDDKFAKKT